MTRNRVRFGERRTRSASRDEEALRIKQTLNTATQALAVLAGFGADRVVADYLELAPPSESQRDLRDLLRGRNLLNGVLDGLMAKPWMLP